MKDKLKQIEEASLQINAYCRVYKTSQKVGNIESDFGRVDFEAQRILETLKEIQRDFVLVPREMESFSWYLDAIDPHPFIIKEIGNECYVVMDNPKKEILVGSAKYSTEQAIYCERFYSEEAALHYYRVQTAKALYAAIIGVCEND